MFNGQIMICFMCKKKRESDPNVSSDWTFLEFEGYPGVYVCPGCLQDSPAGRRGDFAAAYAKVLRRIIRKAK